MTQYVKSTSFSSKDTLPVGNPLKIVKGTEIDTEFNNIAIAVATKADLLSPVFTGTPTAATAATSTVNTQLATTQYVSNKVLDLAAAKDGTGATGTWPISITGNAATATLATLATTATTATTAANGGVTSVNGSTGAVTVTSIGVGQTWQTPARALSTNYTNSTGKPIQVIAAVYAQGNTRCRAIVDGVTIVESLTQDCCGVPQISYFPLSFIVPNNSVYQCQGGALNTWAELR